MWSLLYFYSVLFMSTFELSFILHLFCFYLQTTCHLLLSFSCCPHTPAYPTLPLSFPLSLFFAVVLRFHWQHVL